MKVFAYGTEEDVAYVYAPEATSEACLPDPPRALSRGWSPPEFELIREDEFRRGLPIADFLSFTIASIVLSERAADRLNPVLRDSGELLPIQLSDTADQYYLFNVTRVVNAVDMDRTRFLRFPSGRVMKVEQLEFAPARVPKEPVFFKTTQLGAVTDIYATDAAVAAVHAANLTGHDFRLVWSGK